MRLLAIDVGSGTQDILLLDTSRPVENSPKMVMPSPTVVMAARIREATRRGQDVLLTGSLMGGGPCAWAAEAHLKAGYRVFATPAAARTFNDDLAEVERMGVKVVSEEEARSLHSCRAIVMKDLDMEAIGRAFQVMGVPCEPDGLAVAALDHGEAPPGYSDRLFRFDHFRRVLARRSDLYAFALLPEELPAYLTRLKAVGQAAGEGRPLLLLDTGVAAALGALEDPMVGRRRNALLVNVGNMHTLAMHVARGKVLAFAEHHTGFMGQPKLDDLLSRFMAGSVSHQEVFDDQGHGVLYLDRDVARGRPFLSVTGPQRQLMARSSLRPYFAAPHGDMMLAGCFGLARAFARRFPQWREEIETALFSG
ncbi:MAG: DUF1786 domain-containing protein [Chloroflexi bacterium]|nr:DUF1786 domain-containing protein [Chloroflexota bacterium]